MDFSDASDVTTSGLYKHIYQEEYDTPGGEPISVMIADYEFDASAEDIKLLQEISKVSAAAHCPFIAGVSTKFFNKTTFDEVVRMEDLTNYMGRAEYIRWSAFRDLADARYIGLTLPRFLLRLPYGRDNHVRSFDYQESIDAQRAGYYLWGNASFAFAANMTRSFKRDGWIVNIRGPESGGKVEGLPLHQFDAGKGLITKAPTETIITETREL